MVWALAVTETISYGVLYYSFAAFLLPMQRSLGVSQTTLTGAFSLGVLVTGAGAVPAGAWLDCCGARGLMTAGSLLAAGCVLLWAHAGSVLALYLTFAGIGLAGAAVLYEPAYATINAYFDSQRQQALLTLTMVAGLASTIFVPGAAVLITHLGWRHALLVLAGVQAVTVVPHAWLLRRRPADHGWQRDGIRGIASLPATASPRASQAAPGPEHAVSGQVATVLRSRPVALLTAGTVLGSAAIAAVAVHLLAYLREDGYTLAVAAAAAAAAAGALGVVQVAGRIVLTASARRMPAAVATAILLAGQVAGVAALLLISGPPGVVLFVLLFGAGFGVLSIARPDQLARYAPRHLYARLSGIQALLVIAGEAAAPTAAAVLRAATGSYTPVFIAIACCSLAAALLFLAADHAHSRAPVPQLPGPAGGPAAAASD
ncbi:MAG: MFS transporter [Streptosporangiaceae bacterium]|jgi:MFS family permease